MIVEPWKEQKVKFLNWDHSLGYFWLIKTLDMFCMNCSSFSIIHNEICLRILERERERENISDSRPGNVNYRIDKDSWKFLHHEIKAQKYE